VTEKYKYVDVTQIYAVSEYISIIKEVINEFLEQYETGQKNIYGLYHNIDFDDERINCRVLK
jgi:hypothetical protein